MTHSYELTGKGQARSEAPQARPRTCRQNSRGIREHVNPGAVLYTDEAHAYKGMPEFRHEAVKHSVGEFVRDMAHTNGIESFWATLKRAHKGVYHKISPKHLQRYINEFAGRHCTRDDDTRDQMTGVVAGLVGKRLMYRDLIA